MNSNPYKGPKQKLVTRLLFSVVCVYFGYLQITRTEIHGVPAGPDIQGRNSFYLCCYCCCGNHNFAIHKRNKKIAILPSVLLYELISSSLFVLHQKG